MYSHEGIEAHSVEHNFKQLPYIYYNLITFYSYKWVVPFTYLTDDSSLKSKPLNMTSGETSFGSLKCRHFRFSEKGEGETGAL